MHRHFNSHTDAWYRDLHSITQQCDGQVTESCRCDVHIGDAAWEAAITWCATNDIADMPAAFITAKTSADASREKYAALEAKLAVASTQDAGSTLGVYREYIAFETEDTATTPDRVVLVYERAIADNALQADVWLGYTQYLDFGFKGQEAVAMIGILSIYVTCA